VAAVTGVLSVQVLPAGPVYLVITGQTQCTRTQCAEWQPGRHEIPHSRYTSPRSAPVPGQSEHNKLNRWPIGAKQAQKLMTRGSSIFAMLAGK